MSNHTDCIITAERAANCANWPEGNSVEVQTYNVQRDTEGGGGREGWRKGKKEKKEQDKSGKGKQINNSFTFFHSFIDWCSFSPEYDRKEQKEERTGRETTKTKTKKKSERAAGIEPATTGFAILCSTTELNAQNIG